MTEYYSHGKLLLTSEYLVLDGALALALPTRFGQTLSVTPCTAPVISWSSKDHDGQLWFQEKFSRQEINTATANQHDTRGILCQILQLANQMNPHVLEAHPGYMVETALTFPRRWGLGSSSTLICNIAAWFAVSPYELLKKTFGGSGYDIACGIHDLPILYQLREGEPYVEQIPFNPSYTDHLYFVYLNQKQDSRAAIAAYRKKTVEKGQEYIAMASHLTEQIVQPNSFEDFIDLINQHELLLSAILDMPTVKRRLFVDFNGGIKSLGAWGGDFILVASKENPTTYFASRGYQVVLPYKAMIK